MSAAIGRWRVLRAAGVLLGVLLVPAGAIDARAEATVRDIRVASSEGGTQVVIDLSRQVSFRHIVLTDPPRLAIDLPEVAWLVPDSFGDQTAGMIKGFRFGRFRPGVSRLVIDVARPFEISNVFELPANDVHGHRIVTEIATAQPGSRRPTAAALGFTQLAELPRQETTDVSLAPALGQQTAAIIGPLRQPPRDKPAPGEGGRRMSVIDPGHGGLDPGAIGKSGVYEKNIVLAIAKELRRQLEGTGRYKVVLTREDDSTVPLRDRLTIAREAGGDLFLSLHADSLVNHPDVLGAAVYTLSERASSQEAAALARKENRAEILSGVDLSGHEEIVTQILIDLAQRDANNKSIRFADSLVEELSEVTRMARRRRQQAGFVVLKSPDMPSALIELGYLSNPVDERRLDESGYQAQLSKAIVAAINRFFMAEAS
jgi:N-acetylmuramoyl-L-alanine amidase